MNQKEDETKTIHAGEVIKNISVEAYEEYQNGLKIKKIKKQIVSGTLDKTLLSVEELALSKQMESYIEVLPDEYHKCIGCHCNEHSYPKCNCCPFYKYCLVNGMPFEQTCNDGDCQKLRTYVVNQAREVSRMNEKEKGENAKQVLKNVKGYDK